MAKFRGNIWTKAAGSIGSITFSKARNRSGKVQTARERVVPLNPQTPGQVSARDNLSDSNFIAKEIGADGYFPFFDRTISKLPGYQSIVSGFQRVKSTVGSSIVFQSPPPSFPLGNLFPVSIIGSDHISAMEFSVNWSTGTGANGQPNDPVIILGMTAEFLIADIGNFRVTENDTRVRSDGSGTIDLGGFGPAGSDAVIMIFAVPAADNPALQAARTEAAIISNTT